MELNRDWLGMILSPQTDACIICSNPIVAYTSTNGKRPWLTKLRLEQSLCSSCFAEIAWIDNILCPCCGRSERCSDCKRRTSSSLWINRSAVRYNEAMKHWLHRYKFQGDERLSSLLATMLRPAVERVSFQLIRHYDLEKPWRASGKLPTAWLQQGSYCWDVVTSVPLSEQRFRERGFNQAEQLALEISDHFSIPYYNLLYRKIHSQTRNSHQGRQARIRESNQKYSGLIEGLHRLFKEQGKRISRKNVLNVLLIDDVYTTGSTLHACSDALLEVSPISLVIASVTWARA